MGDAPLVLFPKKSSGDSSPARHNESHYEFLARADTAAWQRVREALTEWVGQMPGEVRADVIARLQADDTQHRAAWWEVYLHAALIRAGYQLIPHPEVAGSTRRPDYLVRGSGVSFYVEARITGHQPTDMAARRRLNAVYDLLNDIDSPNFFLDVDVEATTNQPPGTRQLRNDLEAWLASLDPDAITSPEEWPSWTWRNQTGWALVFRAIPKSPKARGKPDMRAMGIYDHGGVRIVDNKTPLLDALQFKGSRYGTLELPFVVAVMEDGDYPPDASSIADALYGTSVCDLDPATGTVVERKERAADGYWRDTTGPRHTLVSAVITAWNLSPWEVPRRYPRVWHNPRAASPLIAPLPFPAVRYRPEQNDFEEAQSVTKPGDLFGLPIDWPQFPARSWEQPNGEAETADSGM